MSIKHVLLMIGLSVFFLGCSTARINFDREDAYSQDTTTDKGYRYLLGKGVKRNQQKAFSYFLAAARADNVFAQNQVAYLYAAGIGTPKDVRKSFYYYKKAANRGLASAQYNLALLYRQGLGTEKNMAMAQHWLEKAAANGFAPALEALQHASAA